jgi:hypothetical protein
MVGFGAAFLFHRTNKQLDTPQSRFIIQNLHLLGSMAAVSLTAIIIVVDDAMYYTMIPPKTFDPLVDPMWAMCIFFAIIYGAGGVKISIMCSVFLVMANSITVGLSYKVSWTKLVSPCTIYGGTCLVAVLSDRKREYRERVIFLMEKHLKAVRDKNHEERLQNQQRKVQDAKKSMAVMTAVELNVPGSTSPNHGDYDIMDTDTDAEVDAELLGIQLVEAHGRNQVFPVMCDTGKFMKAQTPVTTGTAQEPVATSKVIDLLKCKWLRFLRSPKNYGFVTFLFGKSYRFASAEMEKKFWLRRQRRFVRNNRQVAFILLVFGVGQAYLDIFSYCDTRIPPVSGIV